MKSGKTTANPSPALPLSGEGAATPPLMELLAIRLGYQKAIAKSLVMTRGGREGFIPYNTKLTELARENRKNPTAAESKMWNQVLRMRHFSDYKFSRQKPIGSFIVDFYCSALRLAIEIDGDSHAKAVEYDAARTSALNARGVTVVRYMNDDVLKNLPGVYEDLKRKIALLDEGHPKQ